MELKQWRNKTKRNARRKKKEKEKIEQKNVFALCASCLSVCESVCDWGGGGSFGAPRLRRRGYLFRRSDGWLRWQRPSRDPSEVLSCAAGARLSSHPATKTSTTRKVKEDGNENIFKKGVLMKINSRNRWTANDEHWLSYLKEFNHELLGQKVHRLHCPWKGLHFNTESYAMTPIQKRGCIVNACSTLFLMVSMLFLIVSVLFLIGSILF